MDGDSILQVVGEKLQQSRPEDEFDIVGKNVAQKLKKLDPNTRIFAEKIINDALFEAQLGTLNRNAYLFIPQPYFSAFSIESSIEYDRTISQTILRAISYQ